MTLRVISKKNHSLKFFPPLLLIGIEFQMYASWCKFYYFSSVNASAVIASLNRKKPVFTSPYCIYAAHLSLLNWKEFEWNQSQVIKQQAIYLNLALNRRDGFWFHHFISLFLIKSTIVSWDIFHYKNNKRNFITKKSQKFNICE